MGDQPLSAADRLKARVQKASGVTVEMTAALDSRRWWVKLVEDTAEEGAHSETGLTLVLAEGLIEGDRAGRRCPPELYEMARAYLQPRYRADRDRSRTHDPATSQQAANDEKRPRRSRSHAHRLLEAYCLVSNRMNDPLTPEAKYYGGLTAPEAALLIGKVGAWRRTPELHQDGLIEILPWREYAGPVPKELQSSTQQFPEMPATRPTVYGAQSRVFRITAAGRIELARMNREERAWNKAREVKAARKAARGNKA
jgi:hypothetical protein